MPLELEHPITIARAGRTIGLPDKTGSHDSEAYVGLGTGDGVFGPSARLQKPPKVTPPAGKKDRKSSTKPQSLANVRRAFRVYWNEAQSAAEAMLQAAETSDLMGVGLAADRLDQSLGELWKVHEARDLDWQTILNHMQGMMRTFFQERRAESLTVEQCKRIVALVNDYLGPATKTIDDLSEVVRLIEDAGFDPYAAISGTPGLVANE
jgi:hypothetical protein